LSVFTATRAVKRTGAATALVALAMLGLAFASVKLYRIFCQATGYGGTTQRAEAATLPAGRVGTRTVTVRFDANVAPGMPWTFRPSQVTQQIGIGERKLAYFYAANPTYERTGGQAAYNVSPDTVGKYFVKIQCFCFNQQTLAPGQKADMPVIYYIDPGFLKDPEAAKVKEITLSYTFFPAPPSAIGFPAAPEPAKSASNTAAPQG